MTTICYQLKNNSHEAYINGVRHIFKKHPQLCESYGSAEQYVSLFYSGFVSDCRRDCWLFPLVMRVIDDRYLANGTDQLERYKSAILIGCNNLGRM